MKIIPGSYVKIMFDLKVREFDREISIDSTKRKIREQKEDGTTEEKEILEFKIFKIGANELPKFFEDTLLETDIELDKDYSIEIPPEKAFGSRDPKRIEKISIKTFRARIDQNLFVLEDGSRKPVAGKTVYVNLGGNLIYYGRIIRADSRAVIIDRNHPYAGKKILAHFKITKVIPPTASNEEKLGIILEKFFSDTTQYLDARIEDNTLKINVKREYFQEFPITNRQVAEKVISDLYVPKILLMTWGSNLYSDLGITNIIWHEENELLLPTTEKETKEITGTEKQNKNENKSNSKEDENKLNEQA